MEIEVNLDFRFANNRANQASRRKNRQARHLVKREPVTAVAVAGQAPLLAMSNLNISLFFRRLYVGREA